MEVPRIRTDSATAPLRRVGAEPARTGDSAAQPRGQEGTAGARTESSSPAAPRPDRPLELLGRLVALLPDLGPGGAEPDAAALRLLEVAEGALGEGAGVRERAGALSKASGPDLGPAVVRELLARLVRPGAGGGDLRARVRAAAGDPTALLAALQGAPGSKGASAALEALARLLEPSGSATLLDELPALEAALRQVGRSAPLRADGAWGRWLLGIADALAGALGQGAPRFARALRRGALRGREAQALRALLACGALSTQARRGLLGAALAAAEGRSELGAAVEALAEGDAREAGRSALRGLEADRLLALLRQHAEGELRTALPFPDGADLALLHLFVRPDHGGASADAEGDAAVEPGWRVRLGLDLARLGPLRLDLLWRRDRLLLSISCAATPTLERLREAVSELQEQLSAEGQEVEIVLALAAAESLDLAPESRRVPKPRGDSWMDLAG
jgi:hypothetical protein